MSGNRRSKRNAAPNDSQQKRRRIFIDASTTESEDDVEPVVRKQRPGKSRNVIKSKAARKKTPDSSESATETEDHARTSEPLSSGSDQPIASRRRSKRRIASTIKKKKSDVNNDDSKTTSSTSEESEEEKTTKRRSRLGRRKTRTASRKDSKQTPNKGRKKIKRIIDDEDLQDETKQAEKEERERLQRLKEKENSDKRNENTSSEKSSESIHLTLQKDPLVEVSPYLASKLRSHQIEGIRFIWNNLVESTDRAKDSVGAGCILAHCMGLGKTLQTIAVIHTILKCDYLAFKKALIVAPLNTVRNWIAEFVQWCEDGDELLLYNFAENKTNKARITMLKTWHAEGGVLILGYDMYRIMATKIVYGQWKKVVKQTLIDPGPDVVVCDEGHTLKNADSYISKELSKIRTRRRIVLTGTPLQNNLIEYHCMVNFVKPELLGSLREFRNRFVNPITNGQHTDSTELDVNVMKKRSHVLHQILEGFVQRKDYTCLKPYLSSKFEYVIKVRLTPLQIKLYRYYLDTMTNRGVNNDIVNAYGKGSSLLADYQTLMRVWTHPKSLLIHSEQQEKILKRKEENDFITDAEDSASGSDEWHGSDNEQDQKVKDEGSENVKLDRKVTENIRILTSDTTDTDEEVTRKRRLIRSKRKKSTVKMSSDDTASSNNSASDASGTSSENDSTSDSEEAEKLPHLRTRSKKPGEKRRYRLRRAETDEDDESDELIELDNSAPKEEAWYEKILQEDPKSTENYENSLKLVLLFEILRMAEERKEKVLVFSQSLISLDIIEEMLMFAPPPSDIDGEGNSSPSHPNPHCRWFKNIDYFRMDGGTQSHHRQRWINAFNDENDTRSRLFLISTKAGGLGVNLIGANRVVIFDASWNPSHDTQSMFRVYRFGQTKTCYIYRFIAEGTMEEKIYQRQVNKQSLAFRVVDEQQINRHFTASSLAEMYAFEPTSPDNSKPEKLPIVPKDEILAEILSDPRTRHMIASYHEHDSLLDHQVDEELTEEERKAAWEEYEAAKIGRVANSNPINPSTQVHTSFNNFLGGLSPMLAGIANNVTQNPKVAEMQVLLERLSKTVTKAYLQYQNCEVRSVFTIRNHLQASPLYKTADSRTVDAIAKEVNARLQKQKEDRYRKFQGLNMQFRMIHESYFAALRGMPIGSNQHSSFLDSASTSPLSIPSKLELLSQMAPAGTSSASSFDGSSSQPSQSSTSISEVIDITEDGE